MLHRAVAIPVLEMTCKHGHKQPMPIAATNSVVEALHRVQQSIRGAAGLASREVGEVTLVVVSKTHGADKIRPVLDAGHRVFGENKVQETQSKWPALRQAFPDVELHLIGPLQSNKAADAVALFDVIETVDRDKIAQALAKEMRLQNRNPRLLVQVNTGAEPQKAGVLPQDLPMFLQKIMVEYGLTISGLMAIPPVDENPSRHFQLLRKLALAAKLPLLSMGMSGDYPTAIAHGCTHVRIGSAIFGARLAALPPLAK